MIYSILAEDGKLSVITANSSSVEVAELRYHPWGGTRYTSGTTPTAPRP